MSVLEAAGFAHEEFNGEATLVLRAAYSLRSKKTKNFLGRRVLAWGCGDAGFVVISQGEIVVSFASACACCLFSDWCGFTIFFVNSVFLSAQKFRPFHQSTLTLSPRTSRPAQDRGAMRLSALRE